MNGKKITVLAEIGSILIGWLVFAGVLIMLGQIFRN